MCLFRMKSWVFLRVDSGEKEFKVQKENFERALASSVCLERVNFNERGLHFYFLVCKRVYPNNMY